MRPATGFPGGGGTIQTRWPQAGGVESSLFRHGSDPGTLLGEETLACFLAKGAPAAREPLDAWTAMCRGEGGAA
jgi:hypothetical protein